ncbi:transcriptional regulator [Gordonia crocea]|uniref:Putative transcriptional regulator n=1 Tax=Gordonia crocea TaxID=589162 RepID=A0A7M3SUU4_9ACTN|nr:transcriptional regulator [Gordonia crocea]GED96418.1 putative transcriptional regulator [Gordonia crocea]
MGNGAASPLRVTRAYEAFLSGIVPAEGSVRALVRDSWLRSRDRGVDPQKLRPQGEDVGEQDFRAYRDAHPLSSVRALIQSLLIDDLDDSGAVVAVGDERGRLLWVDGDRSARSKVTGINFVEGSVWSETAVGTNAPGLALALDQGVQVVGPEHFAGPVQRWNCSAAPIHDPLTGGLLGVLDITGGEVASTPFALTTVRSVVAAIERELAAKSIDLSTPTRSAVPRLEMLDDGPRWITADGLSRPLSPRHAEILLLLAAYPQGLSTEQLATKLADDGLGAVTVRAEISRLRRALGDVVESRPYRLTVAIESDVGDTRSHIEKGEIIAAIRTLGRGGLLAESFAPGVVELFDELLVDLRSRMVAAGDVPALEEWVASPLGRDDPTAWAQLARTLPSSHPGRARAVGRARLLDRRFSR